MSHDIKNQLHLDDLQIGLLGSLFFFSYAVSQLFTGYFFDRLGAKVTLCCSAFIAALGLCLLGMSQTLQMAGAAQLLIGLGLSTAYIGVIYVVGRFLPETYFAVMSGVSQMSSNITVGAVVILMSFSGGFVSFRVVMVAFAIVIVLLALLMILTMPSTEPGTLGLEKETPVTFVSSAMILFKIPQFWLSVIFFSCGFGVMLSLSDLWNIPTQEAYGYSLAVSARVNTMIPLGAALGALLSGILANHFNNNVLIARYIFSGIFFLSALFIYGPVLSLPLTFMVLFLLGFFFGGTVLGFTLLKQHIPLKLIGLGFGFMSMAAYLTSGLLQVLVGKLLDENAAMDGITQFRLALIPLMITLGVGYICVFYLRDKKTPVTE